MYSIDNPLPYIGVKQSIIYIDSIQCYYGCITITPGFFKGKAAQPRSSKAKIVFWERRLLRKPQANSGMQQVFLLSKTMIISFR